MRSTWDPQLSGDQVLIAVSHTAHHSSQKMLSSGQYTQRGDPSRSFHFTTEIKQSNIFFMKLFFIILNDFRTAHLPPYPTLNYQRSLKKSFRRWLSQIIHQHKILSFISGQSFGSCSTVLSHIKFIFHVTSILLVFVTVFCLAFHTSMNNIFSS